MIETPTGFVDFLDFYNYVTNPQKSELLLCPNCNSKVTIKLARSFNMRVYGQAEITCTNLQCEFSKKKIYIEGGAGINA